MPIKGKNLFTFLEKINLLHDNKLHQLEYFKPELFLFLHAAKKTPQKMGLV